MGDLLDTIRPALQALTAAPRWRVAVSGGVDSTVLLHLLRRYRDGGGGAPLSVIHVDHGLSPRAAAWAAHCAELCRAWQVPFDVRRVDVVTGREGPEAAAREARWRVLAETAETGEILFVAHHRDDQVETALLRLLRGSGTRGLAAMIGLSERRGFRVCRPLLDIRREQIAGYASAHGLVWVDDESNADERLSRNWLRRRLLPLLAGHWPDYRERIAATTAHCADDAALLDEIADSDLAGATGSDRFGPWLDLATVADLSRQRARNAAARWLATQGAPAPAPGQWRSLFDDLIAAAADRMPRIDLGKMTLRRFRGRLYLVGPLAAPVTAHAQPLAPGQTLSLPGGGTLAWCNGNGYNGDVEVRLRRGGEHFRHSPTASMRPLKKLLAELAVPPWLRDRVPLLYASDELVAIADLLVSQQGAAIFGEPPAIEWLPPAILADR